MVPWLIMRSVTIMSIVRLTCLVKGNLNDDPDSTWSFVDVVLWSTAELNVAVVCGEPCPFQFLSAFVGGRTNKTSLMIACLPFLRPILNRTAKVLHISTPFHSTQNRQPSIENPQVGKEQDCGSLGVHAFAASTETSEHLPTCSEGASEQNNKTHAGIPGENTPYASLELRDLSCKNTAPNGAIMVTREICIEQTPV